MASEGVTVTYKPPRTLTPAEEAEQSVLMRTARAAMEGDLYPARVCDPAVVARLAATGWIETEGEYLYITKVGLRGYAERIRHVLRSSDERGSLSRWLLELLEEDDTMDKDRLLKPQIETLTRLADAAPEPISSNDLNRYGLIKMVDAGLVRAVDGRGHYTITEAGLEALGRSSAGALPAVTTEAVLPTVEPEDACSDTCEACIPRRALTILAAARPDLAAEIERIARQQLDSERQLKALLDRLGGE
ncbi:MAG: hypothetical protein OHK0046_46280 [Anaerolineae bacterium]